MTPSLRVLKAKARARAIERCLERRYEELDIQGETAESLCVKGDVKILVVGRLNFIWMTREVDFSTIQIWQGFATHPWDMDGVYSVGGWW